MATVGCACRPERWRHGK